MYTVYVCASNWLWMGGSGPLDPGSKYLLRVSWRGYQTLNGGFLRIDKFAFGSIVINGKEHKQDVFITDDFVEEKESSHEITKDVIDKALLLEPNSIIVGRGTSGMVIIPDEIRDILAQNNVELIEGKTPDAIEDFNNLKGKNKVVGIFHLTC